MTNSSGVPPSTPEQIAEFERVRDEMLAAHVALGGHVLPPDDGSFMQVVFMPTPPRPPQRK